MLGSSEIVVKPQYSKAFGSIIKEAADEQLNETEVREVQPKKAAQPILVIVAGIVMDVRPEH